MRAHNNQSATISHSADHHYENAGPEHPIPAVNRTTFCRRTLSLLFDTTKHLVLDFIQTQNQPLKILKITILVAVTPILLLLFPLTLIYIIQKIIQDVSFFPIQRRLLTLMGETPTTVIDQTSFIEQAKREHRGLLSFQQIIKENLWKLERKKNDELDQMDQITIHPTAPDIADDRYQALQKNITKIEEMIQIRLKHLQQLEKKIRRTEKHLRLIPSQTLEHIIYRNNVQEIHTYLYRARVPTPEGIHIIFHGNSITAQWDALTSHSVIYAGQQHCLFVEYPGFNGAEGGIYSEREFLDTAETAYNMAVTYFPNVPISLFGQSIGTGAAAYLAGQHPSDIERVVLHAPYTSLTDLIGYHVNPCLAAIFSHYRVNTQDYLVDYVTQNPKAEVVLIHADEENADQTVIPQAHSVALNAACQRARDVRRGQQNIVLFKLHRDYGHAGLPDEMNERLFCKELATLDPAPFKQQPHPFEVG